LSHSRAYFIGGAGSIYVAIVWHQHSHKKPFIFIVLTGVPCALGRRDPPAAKLSKVMIHVEFKAGTSEFGCGRTPFGVDVPTLGFDDWPDGIAGIKE